MRETEESIRRSMDKLKTTQPFVWQALQLRKKLAQWQAQTAGLNVVQLVSAFQPVSPPPPFLPFLRSCRLG